MSTILVTTCYLNESDYLKKTIKWLNFYSNLKIADEILLLDNKSNEENIQLLNKNTTNCEFWVHRFDEHFNRPSHLDYKYLWRAVDFYKDIFDRGFSKIIYTDNDFYMTSDKMLKYVSNANSGWESPFCNKHGFPETGLQVITKDYYKSLNVKSFLDYNGKVMETTLPLTKIEKSLIGDRWSEFPKEIPKDADFSAQTTLNEFVLFGLK